MRFRFRIEPLGAHDRSSFSCGDPELDRYFRQLISQDVRRRAARAFVAVALDTGEAVGFYTLSAGAVERGSLPPRAASKAPPYARVPVVLLGRLAVHIDCQGQGLGGALLFEALARAEKSELGIYAMIVEPKSDPAGAFYRRHGFQPTDTDPSVLFLPLASAGAAR